MEEISFVENPRELLDHAFQIPDVVPFTFHFSFLIFDFFVPESLPPLRQFAPIKNYTRFDRKQSQLKYM